MRPVACLPAGVSPTATVDEIAREAGIAKGTIYLYYKSKGDVYARGRSRGAARAARANGQQRPRRRDRVRQGAGVHRDQDEVLRAQRRLLPSLLRRAQRSGRARLGRQRAEPAAVPRADRPASQRNCSASSRIARTWTASAMAISALTYGVITRRLKGWSTSSLEADIDYVVLFRVAGSVRAMKAHVAHSPCAVARDRAAGPGPDLRAARRVPGRCAERRADRAAADPDAWGRRATRPRAQPGRAAGRAARAVGRGRALARDERPAARRLRIALGRSREDQSRRFRVQGAGHSAAGRAVQPV